MHGPQGPARAAPAILPPSEIMSYTTYGPTQFGFGSRLTPWVKRLLVANIAVFCLVVLVAGLVGAPAAAEGYPGYWPNRFLAFAPADLLTQPWGIVTYMFAHGGLWHLLVNMLMLFFFGPPLEQKWGSGEFIKYYLICGVGGVALSFIFAIQANIIGASAAVFGIMLAFAMNWPDSPIYIWGILPVKAKWLVGVLGVLTFFMAVGQPGDGVAHTAHLGGFVAGLIYLKSDWRLGATLDRLREATHARRFAVVSKEDDEDGSPNRPRQERKRRERAPSSTRRRARGQGSEEELLDRVDDILDKISQEGMGSLTSEERRILDEVSRRRRSN